MGSLGSAAQPMLCSSQSSVVQPSHEWERAQGRILQALAGTNFSRNLTAQRGKIRAGSVTTHPSWPSEAVKAGRSVAPKLGISVPLLESLPCLRSPASTFRSARALTLGHLGVHPVLFPPQ
jgi:hypothetical protein